MGTNNFNNDILFEFSTVPSRGGEITRNIQHLRAHASELLVYIMDDAAVEKYSKKDVSVFKDEYINLYNNHGIYFLLHTENKDSAGKMPVYVGKTEKRKDGDKKGIARISEHLTDRLRGKWNLAVFITLNQVPENIDRVYGYTGDEVAYLEAVFIKMTKKCKNAKSLNEKNESDENKQVVPKNYKAEIKAIKDLLATNAEIGLIIDDNEIAEYIQRNLEETAKLIAVMRADALREHKQEIHKKYNTADAKRAYELGLNIERYEDFLEKTKGMRRLLGVERINKLLLKNGRNDEIITKPNVAKEIIALLDIKEIDSSRTYLDIYCKSGNFFIAIIDKYMDLSKGLSADTRRDILYNLITNQLYGICTDNTLRTISTLNIIDCVEKHLNEIYGGSIRNSKRIYNLPNLIDIDNFNKNVKLLSGTGTDFKNEKTYNGFLARTMRIKNEIEKEILEKANENRETKIMKFSTVIGNPPYNNDEYIDFVNLAKHLVTNENDSSKSGSVCMITPAKWQAKDGIKNELFRQTIVPYMKEIVYYPDAKEVFDIALSGGITYYKIDREIHDTKDTIIINKGNIRKQNIPFVGALDINDIDIAILNKINKSMKIKRSNKFILKRSFICVRVDGSTHTNEIKLKLISKSGTGVFFRDSKFNIEIDPIYVTKPEELGKYHLLTNVWLDNTPRVELYSKNEVSTDNNFCIYSTDNEEEIKSVKSYFECKLIWWLISRFNPGCNANENSFRLVPAPEAFDHIFTDAELYKKYNLTEEEINIIESVIKERK